MVWGGLATLLGLVVRPLGQVVAWIAWIFLTYTIESVRLTSQLPFTSVPVQMDAWMVFVYYILLGGLTWWLAQPKERRKELWNESRSSLFSHLSTRALVGAALILLVLAFFAWRSLPDGRLHVVFLDVGQGDAIFIQTPSGKQVLIDGGPSETVLLSQLGRHMPFWDRTLDVVMLTHPDSDHITGLVGVLERYQVDTVVFRAMERDDEVYDQWLKLLTIEDAAIHQGEAGLGLTLDQGLEMTVLHPGVELFAGTTADSNNNSIVTRLVYGQVSVLLTGDIEAVVEQQLVRDGAMLASIVLKAAHHGSCTSTTETFLEAVDPEVVVISVGTDNDFGQPCAEVLERLEGLLVFRTDEDGVVEVISDGGRVWVKTEH
jgi:competence protein ComEC